MVVYFWVILQWKSDTDTYKSLVEYWWQTHFTEKSSKTHKYYCPIKIQFAFNEKQKQNKILTLLIWHLVRITAEVATWRSYLAEIPFQKYSLTKTCELWALLVYWLWQLCCVCCWAPLPLPSPQNADQRNPRFANLQWHSSRFPPLHLAHALTAAETFQILDL